MNTDTVGERNRIGPIPFLMAAGLAVFLLGMTLAPVVPFPIRIGALALVTIVSLGVALIFWGKPSTKRYWRLAFAYCVAGCAVMMGEFGGDWAVRISTHGVDTLEGFTALKLGEDAAIVGTIVVLALVTRDDLGALYLKLGRLGKGLAIGLGAFGCLTILGVLATWQQGFSWAHITAVLPAFLLIVLADGFMEELLFRGLFLKRMVGVVGFAWANVITAAVFALSHLGVDFAAAVVPFVIAVFLLGLLWGWLMRFTDGILAPALVHAGVDMLIIRDALETFAVAV